MSEKNSSVPRHLWVVGVLALLWNAIGAFDYAATQFRYEPYMSQFTPEQLEYFYGLPAWTDATWAIAVWGALLASIGLLLRKRWSVALFGVSIAAMVLTAVHNFLLSEGAAIMGQGAVVFTAVIWIIAFALFFYARALSKRSVLR